MPGRTCLAVFAVVFLVACTAQGAGAPPVQAGPQPTVRDDPGVGSNRVSFEVDGQAFSFRTPQVRHGRSRAGEGVVAESFELASADQALYARLVLHVEPGRGDLSGRYRVVPGGRERAQAGTAELMLAEETDPVRGRRMFPSGEGLVEVEDREGYLRVRFTFTGDGLFRAAEAAPVVGELAFQGRR